jgi:hypothetical protein
MTRPICPDETIEQKAPPNGRPAAPPVERLTYRFDEVAAAIGVSRRLLERERSAGRFPTADLHIGRVPLWRISSVKDYLERGGRS